MALPESRLEARLSGSKYYSTGKPCIYGHIAKRKTGDGNCYQCILIKRGLVYKKEKLLGINDLWSKKNPEKRAEINRRNRTKYPEKRLALNACRRAKKLKATPDWLSKADLDLIESFYKKARELKEFSGIPFDVDHIVPLQSSIVCGLHVPWNLQVIPKELNARKSNKFNN